MHSENPPDRTKVSCNVINYQSLVVVTAEMLCLVQERRRREEEKEEES